jgi:hypothetical protein
MYWSKRRRIVYAVEDLAVKLGKRSGSEPNTEAAMRCLERYRIIQNLSLQKLTDSLKRLRISRGDGEGLVAALEKFAGFKVADFA